VPPAGERAVPPINWGARQPLHDAIVRLRAPQAAEPQCFTAVLFHVEKCAGTSIRRHFLRLREQEGIEVYRQGSIVFERRWPEEALVPHTRCSDGPSWFNERLSCTWGQWLGETLRHPEWHRRAFIEMGAMTSGRMETVEGVLRDLDRLRSAPGREGCHVVSLALFREPVAHFVSLYNYFVINKQARNPEGYGRTFEEYVQPAHVHNYLSRLAMGEQVLLMQRRLPPRALARAASAPELAWRKRLYEQTPEQVEARLPRLFRLLDRLDLVAPVERFDELFLLLCDRVGLRDIHYVLVNTMDTKRLRESRRDPLKPRPWVIDRPPRVGNLTAATRAWLEKERMRADLRLHARVAARWAEVIRRQPREVRRRLRRFEELMRTSRELDRNQTQRTFLRVQQSPVETRPWVLAEEAAAGILPRRRGPYGARYHRSQADPRSVVTIEDFAQTVHVGWSTGWARRFVRYQPPGRGSG